MKRVLASLIAFALICPPVFSAGNPAKSKLYDVTFNTVRTLPGSTQPVKAAADIDGSIYYLTTANTFSAPIYRHGPGGNSDVVLVKYMPVFNKVEWVVIIGGSDVDNGAGVAVLKDRRIAIVGTTTSQDFPVSAVPAQRENAGGGDAFVILLSESGQNIYYSTYFGDKDREEVNENSIAVDNDGAIYFSGQTDSDHLPGGDTGIRINTKMKDGASFSNQTRFYSYVTKIDPNFPKVRYTLHFDRIHQPPDFGVDGHGALYVAIQVASDVRLEKSSDEKMPQGVETSLYMAKFQSNGFLEYGRFISFGPNTHLWSDNITVTADGYVYLGLNAASKASGLYRIDPQGFPTQLDQEIFIDHLAIDTKQRIWVAGASSNSDFKVTKNAHQKGFLASSSNAFLRVYDPSGEILYSSFYSGNGAMEPQNIFFDNRNAVRVLAASGIMQEWSARRILELSLEAAGVPRPGTPVQLRAVVKEDGRVLNSSSIFKKWKVLGKNEFVHLDNDKAANVMATFDQPGSYYLGGEFDPVGLNAPLLTVNVSAAR